jgi:hypothetical protein
MNGAPGDSAAFRLFGRALLHLRLVGRRCGKHNFLTLAAGPVDDGHGSHGRRRRRFDPNRIGCRFLCCRLFCCPCRLRFSRSGAGGFVWCRGGRLIRHYGPSRKSRRKPRVRTGSELRQKADVGCVRQGDAVPMERLCHRGSCPDLATRLCPGRHRTNRAIE